jgi:predicted RNA-binding protein associated with RNAse of E/G family
MKHKRASRLGWHRVAREDETVLALPHGRVVDYVAHEVTAPLVVPFLGRDLRILDSGYRWVHYAPTGHNCALTVHLGPSGVPAQLYVDVGDGGGVDEDGVPYINDLYLDVLAVCEVQPSGVWHVTETEIIDVADLDAALQGGRVTPQQHALAWHEARAAETALRAGTFAPLEVVRSYLTDPYT